MSDKKKGSLEANKLVEVYLPHAYAHTHAKESSAGGEGN